MELLCSWGQMILKFDPTGIDNLAPSSVNLKVEIKQNNCNLILYISTLNIIESIYFITKINFCYQDNMTFAFDELISKFKL